ncbi:MAG: STAS domain-containing protein [Candidatus Eremiobacteraeota bacterium]|nr:STAS domain-containing protein [Candidatus Eremiobacteraeota bacterium]
MSTLMILNGEYDLSCKATFRRELDSLVADERVILDFTNVSYMDSTCLSELVRMNQARKLKSYDSETIVLGNGGAVKKLLTISRLDLLFDVTDSIDAALEKSDGSTLIRYSFGCDGHSKTA